MWSRAGIFLITILLIRENSSGNYADYIGTQCTGDEDCGQKILCQDGFCACSLHGTFTFDKIQKTCATRAGFDCSQGYPCVSNAHCNQSTEKCVCDSSFSETSFGECRLNYGAECGGSSGLMSCNPEKFLRCNIEWNRCTCANDDEQIYNVVSDSCLARPGERCELFQYEISPPCVKNAICVPTSTEFGKCICSEGFANSDSSFCLPAYGYPCELYTGCAFGRNLECQLMHDESGSVCTCQNGTIFNKNSVACERHVNKAGTCPNPAAIYDINSDRCRIKVSHPCHQENNSDICVRHAVCDTGICQCTRNHVATESGQCQLSYGSRCIPDDLTEAGETTECHQDSFLSCIRGTCQCHPGEIFEEDIRSCVQLVSTPCDLFKNRCIRNARCTQVANDIFLCKNATTTTMECDEPQPSSTPRNSDFNYFAQLILSFNFLAIWIKLWLVFF